MVYDLLVVGAGPAGATAARTAAESGMKVALIEKYHLPRHKTCGGGIPTTVHNLISVDPEAFVESKVDHMAHTFRFGSRYCFPINPPESEQQIKVLMCQRSKFDKHLVDKAAESGVDVIDQMTLAEIKENGLFTVICRSKGKSYSFLTESLIGADGANSFVARRFGLREKQIMAFGLEVEVPFDWAKSQHEYLQPNILHIEYGTPRGYAWVFPKEDHLNIGAGIFSPSSTTSKTNQNKVETLKGEIVRYCEELKISCNLDQLKIHAHPLPIWSGKQPLDTIEGRVMLCGDAAGLINPLFADGIYHAVRSGKIAAECRIKGIESQYSKVIHKTFAPNFDASIKIAKLFYRFPQVFYKVAVPNPKATYAAAKLLAGQLEFGDVSERLLKKFYRGFFNPINWSP